MKQELRLRGTDLSRSNIFLSAILRSVPLGVIVMDSDLLIELWNDVAADLWGLRQDEVQGKHFFGLDIGLPVEQLRQPILSLLQSPDKSAEIRVDAMNRRGRPVRILVQCASVSAGKQIGRAHV